MLDLREALCAVLSCRDTASLPVIASLSFQTTNNDGRTIMGNSAKEIAVALADAGVAPVGANCGDLDPLETATVISLIKGSVDPPLLAQPNAGKPRLFDNRTVFDMAPEAFANGIVECMLGRCEHCRRLLRDLTRAHSIACWHS